MSTSFYVRRSATHSAIKMDDIKCFKPSPDAVFDTMFTWTHGNISKHRAAVVEALTKMQNEGDFASVLEFHQHHSETTDNLVSVEKENATTVFALEGNKPRVYQTVWFVRLAVP